MKRTPLLNFLLTAVFWILQLAAQFASGYIMYIGCEDTGRSDGSGFLPITIIHVDPFFLVLGILLSFVLFALIWFFLLRGTWTAGLHLHPVWTLLWIAEALLALLFLFPTFLYAALLKIQLFSRPEPDFEMPFIMTFYIAAILLIVIDCTAMTKKRKKGEAA